MKVADFGIAKSRAASQASASVMVKGKTAYMSPAQADCAPSTAAPTCSPSA